MIGIDPYHADDFATFAEEEAGFTVDEKESEIYGKPLLYKFPQTMAHLAAPTQSFLDSVLSRKIAHGNHPVLRWMIGNVVVNPDSNGNVKPEKGKSADKIDAAVSAVMALALAMRSGNEQQSVYQSRGLLFLDTPW
jgi:phage terminase large subunit-like protein